MNITLFDLAQRHIGIKERSEKDKDHPLIQWWLSLCGYGFDAQDEVPWCSAFVNGMAWTLGLPRSRSAAARSWLEVGKPVPLSQATIGFDVVILSRGAPPSGHVGLFAGLSQAAAADQPSLVHLLGGNQGNKVSVADFPVERVLGVRRLI